MIGLIDCEALNRKTKFIPNLEIMKLYAYYKNGKKKGKIEIEYYSPDELDRIVGLMKKNM